jgi:monovalent cation:H+ antiporter-2, CPA2 family
MLVPKGMLWKSFCHPPRMHDLTFLQDLAVVMIVASVVIILCHRFKQPVVLGYLVAGVIIGPFTPPFPLIRDDETIKTLAELGVIFLMFSLGLEFSFRKLQKVGVPALIIAFLEIILMNWVGYQLGVFFGWSKMDCLFLGAMLSISSTTIIIKALQDLGSTKEKYSELIFGTLIVEDMLAIVIIALLSGIAMTGTLEVGGVVMTLVKLTVFLVVAVVAGMIAVPRLLKFVSRFKSDEALLITVLGLCFSVSLLAVKLNYSVALGAFIIGALIAEAREIGKVEVLTEPIRDMFSAVFFVAIGMMIDPRLLMEYAGPVLAITVAVILGKVATCAVGAFIAGNDLATSVRVGMGLAQIGEFSFIIASLGTSLGVMSPSLYPVVVTVSAVTTLTTPYLIRSSDWFSRRIEGLMPVPVLSGMTFYTRWVQQLRSTKKETLIRKLIRKWMIQISINFIMTVGVFVTAVYFARTRSSWLPGSFLEWGVPDEVIWLAAVIVSLPLFIATYRKLQAFGLLLAENSFKPEGRTASPARMQVLANMIPVLGVVFMTLFVALLSSTLFPKGRVLLVLLIFIGLLLFLLWRPFIRIYSKAQIALQETLSQPPAPRREHTINLPTSFRKAILEPLKVDRKAPVVGKLIRELELRNRTGATIVGIERGQESIVNPGPDEEIKEGDYVFLLGEPEQTKRARDYLSDLKVFETLREEAGG